jgi:hypothetical protein
MGCLAVTVMSPGPETVKVVLLSKPLSENMQMSALAVPLAGRWSEMGLPPSGAHVGGGREWTECGQVEVQVVVGQRNSSGGRIHNDDVLRRRCGRAGGQRDHFIRDIWWGNDE